MSFIIYTCNEEAKYKYLVNIHTYHFVLEDLNKKSITSIFVYLSKAFNRINFNLLIRKCKRLCIQGLQLGKSIITTISKCRKLVTVAGTLSKLAKLTQDIPPGYVLVPVLF